jgi:excisionase family DNA binding protein
MLPPMEKIDTSRPYLTVAQAVERTGWTRSYLAYLMRRGKLEGFRVAREWLIYVDSLESFLASPRKPGPKGPREQPPSA